MSTWFGVYILLKKKFLKNFCFNFYISRFVKIKIDTYSVIRIGIHLAFSRNIGCK